MCRQPKGLARLWTVAHGGEVLETNMQQGDNEGERLTYATKVEGEQNELTTEGPRPDSCFENA